MRIDVQEMLRQTLGIEVEGYVILVAGNAVLTYLLLQAEPDIGVLLFCSIVVPEAPTEAGTHVSILHPDMMVRVTGNPTLQTIVDEILIRLWNVINGL